MKDIDKCSFCGLLETSTTHLVKGHSASICVNCAGIAKEELNYKPSLVKLNLKRPHLVKRHLDQYIIGQEEAKRALSVAVSNHYKRISSKNESHAIKKSNIIMLGPSGTGKTHIVKTLAKLLDVPFVIGDATMLTQAGYVGDDVEVLLKKLVENADYDVEMAERGIVYIDEIDKLSPRHQMSENSTSGATGTAVQAALLKIIEGHEVLTEKNGVTISTENILFIVGGAFAALWEEEEGKTVGFMNNNSATNKNVPAVDTEKLVQYGMIPELIGRLPVVTVLEELTEEDLTSILEKPKDAILKEYKALFAMDGVDIHFTEDAVRYVARNAIKQKVGARGLRSVIEKRMQSLMYEVPEFLERGEGVEKTVNLTITEGLLKGDECWEKQIREGANVI